MLIKTQQGTSETSDEAFCIIFITDITLAALKKTDLNSVASGKVSIHRERIRTKILTRLIKARTVGAAQWKNKRPLGLNPAGC